MSTQYATDLSIGYPIENPFPESRSLAQHHVDCAGDTGTSHMRSGRVYIVQCEWCPDNFVAKTHTKAMEMFRVHEDAMIRLAFAQQQEQHDHDALDKTMDIARKLATRHAELLRRLESK